MSYFPEINKWVIPIQALRIARDELAIDGRNGNEGTCLWLGSKVDGIATVSHVVLLRGIGIAKRPLNVSIAPELMREVHDHAQGLDKILIGQLHSHGPFSGTDFSPTDHGYGVRVPFFLSIVWPNYALDPEIDIAGCGVHVFRPKLGYCRLTYREVRQQIEISSTCKIETITVEMS